MLRFFVLLSTFFTFSSLFCAPQQGIKSESSALADALSPESMQSFSAHNPIRLTSPKITRVITLGADCRKNFKLDRWGYPQSVQKPLEDRMAFGHNSKAQAFTIGVFDGHAGDQISDFFGKNFYTIFNSCQTKFSANQTQEALQSALHLTEEAFRKNALKKGSLPTCGTTASVVHVTNEKVTIGWIGDSTAVVYRNPKLTSQGSLDVVFDATTDHHVSNPQELRRLVALYGGEEKFAHLLKSYYQSSLLDNSTLFQSVSEYERWQAALASINPLTENGTFLPSKNLRLGGLNLARDLGSFDLKKIGPRINGVVRPALSNMPEFLEVPLEEGMIIVVASDGFWDYFNNEDGTRGITPDRLYPLLHSLVQKNFNAQEIAEYLVQHSGKVRQIPTQGKIPTTVVEYRDDITVAVMMVYSAIRKY